MLRIVIDATETLNEQTREFETFGGVVIDLEHSLVSLSKWESKHQKAFLSAGEKTSDEIYDYLKCMIVTPGLDPDVLDRCSVSDLTAIQEYIDSKQSATTFGKLPERRGPAQTITSELVYYWLVIFNIDFECQHWHLNRLFALIRVYNEHQKKPKKLTKMEAAQQQREENARRKASMSTAG